MQEMKKDVALIGTGIGQFEANVGWAPLNDRIPFWVLIMLKLYSKIILSTFKLLIISFYTLSSSIQGMIGLQISNVKGELKKVNSFVQIFTVLPL